MYASRKSLQKDKEVRRNLAISNGKELGMTIGTEVRVFGMYRSPPQEDFEKFMHRTKLKDVYIGMNARRSDYKVISPECFL